MLYHHHFLGDSAVSALPARRSLWRSWLVGTALGGVLAACGGGGGGGGGGSGGGNTASNSASTTTTLAMTSLTVDEAAAETWTLADWFSDPDTGDTLTYTAMELPDWLKLDDTKNELTIAADATDDADVDSHVFTITASDGDDETAVLTATLTVANIAESPFVLTTGAMAAPETLTAMAGERSRRSLGLLQTGSTTRT